MVLLILGGTKNLGRHVVEAALADGHEVTLFNRGLTNPGLFPSVEHLVGERASKTTPGMNESAELLAWPSGAPEDEFSMDLYGPSKARAELLLAEALGERTAAVRSGFVVGPYNPDFGNWGEALATGKAMECAARPEQAIQYLDARDPAAFLVRLSVDGRGGAFNAVSGATTMGAAALIGLKLT